MGELSDSEKEEIFGKMRSLVTTHLQAGITAGSLVLCHNCVYVKPLVGATRYGKYRLCNGCALKYELKKAEGRVKNIEDFVLIGQIHYHRGRHWRNMLDSIFNFFPITGVEIVSQASNIQCEAPCVAVNKKHVFSAEEMGTFKVIRI